MKNSLSIVFIVAAFAFVKDPGRISSDFFKPAFGNWKGTLTYLDYTSGKPFNMLANVSININAKNSNEIIFSYQYPDEPKANGNDTLEIKAEGKMIDDAKVTSTSVSADGTLQIETERYGIDGNDSKKAIIKHVYIISKKSYISRKEVKFIGEQNWIRRNEYSFAR
jgi:hypothetical protein